MSHLQDDTAHQYVSFLTRSQLEAHYQLIYDLITDVDHVLFKERLSVVDSCLSIWHGITGVLAACVFLRLPLPKSNTSWLLRTRLMSA